MAKNISSQDVQEAIGTMMHPAISRTLVELGMLKSAGIMISAAPIVGGILNLIL